MGQSRPTILDMNCTTKQHEIREMNDEEYAQYLKDLESAAAQKVEEQALEG